MTTFRPRIKAISIRDIFAGQLSRDVLLADFAVDLGGIELREAALMRRPDGSCFVAAPVISRNRQVVSFVLSDHDLRSSIVSAAEEAYRRLGGNGLDIPEKEASTP